MSASVPAVWGIVLVGLIGVVLVTAFALRSAGVASGLSSRAAWSVAIGFGIGWTAWSVTSMVLAASHVYRFNTAHMVPGIPLAVVGIVAIALLGTRLPLVKQTLAGSRSLWQLSWPQLLRPVGAAFLVAMAIGAVPAVFALPAGLGDIAVGLEAVYVTIKLKRGDGFRAALWLNIFGLLDLLVAVSIGFAAAPGPTQLLHVTPSSGEIALLPLVLIPTAFVPLAAVLHLSSFAALRRRRVGREQDAPLSVP